MDNKYNEEELVSDFLKARGRKYYFDVKQKSNGDRYLTISELQPNNQKFKRMRILVFEEYLKEFSEKLNKVVNQLDKISSKKNQEGNSIKQDKNQFNHQEES